MIYKLLSKLSNEDKNIVKEILNYVEENLPIDTIYSDMSLQPEALGQKYIEKVKLIKYAEEYWNLQKEMGNEDEIIKDKFLNTEPFCNFHDFSEKFSNYKLEKEY